MHSWYEPAQMLEKICLQKKISLITPFIGEVIHLRDNISTKAWWKSLLKDN